MALSISSFAVCLVLGHLKSWCCLLLLHLWSCVHYIVPGSLPSILPSHLTARLGLYYIYSLQIIFWWLLTLWFSWLLHTLLLIWLLGVHFQLHCKGLGVICLYSPWSSFLISLFRKLYLGLSEGSSCFAFLTLLHSLLSMLSSSTSCAIHASSCSQWSPSILFYS